MNKFLRWMPLVMVLSVIAHGCASSNGPKPFEIEEISSEALIEKMDAQESFVLVAERDGCEFCQAMNEYIDSTKAEHPGITVYRINTTDLELYKEKEDDKILISSTPEGKAFLERFPYFYYTPALYQVDDGKAVFAGIGYDASRHTVSSWNVSSPIEWEQARPVDVWEFITQAADVQKAAQESLQDSAETE